MGTGDWVYVEDRGFESLEFYQDSLKLLKAAYRLADSLPDYERYNLSDQLRRAACSIVLNIAQGYGRYHYLDRLRFLYIARGSLAETKSAFIVAESVGFCTRNWGLVIRDWGLGKFLPSLQSLIPST